MENSIKTNSTIKPAITDNTEYSITKACASVIDLEVGVLLGHGASLRFVSSYFELHTLGNILSKEYEVP